MSQLDLLRDRRRETMLAAARRWSERSSVRTADTASVATFGPGAADSPMRQARFSARQAVLRQAAGLRQRGQLPFFIERKIGPTLDFLSAAPSQAAVKAGRPVARIVSTIDPRLQAEGFATGFLISPSLLITNWHVFPDAASAEGTGANFLHDADEHGLALGVTFAIRPSDFFVSDERLDFAIVAVAQKALTGEDLASIGSVGISEATSKILKGQPIEIIQYPDGGAKQYATRNNRLLDILDEGFLHYETDTLEGSSGAPAFASTWELVALHHAGIPEVRNGQIISTDNTPWSEEMGDDKVHWIANEGARISAIIQALAKLQLTDPRKAKMLGDLLSGTTDPADDVSQMLATGVIAPEKVRIESGQRAALNTLGIGLGSSEMASGTNLNFSGPVTIHVYAPTTQTPVLAPAAGEVALEKTLRFDPNYEDREGYDTAFLGDGIEVPMPTVAAGRQNEMYKEGGDIVILPYHHYSLAMNKNRRLQMWSAANVDYDANLRQQSGRAFFGTDRWIGDPRIPASVQIADPEFYQPATQIDRGHIVRREDSAWGATPKELEFSNSDTFHWTNCTPQHAAFNRASPGREYEGIKGLWGSFENYVQKSLQHEDTKACILAGPVLADDDPSKDFGMGEIKYPVTFWKVVAVKVRDAGGGASLRTYGFVLSQADVVDRFGIEFAPGQYARDQKRLTEITQMTGVEFHQGLLEADTKRA
ncbi:endonuclease G [Bradyrhizobium diazoefficiens]|uniref:DNA/RNA non-specific endonuclease n=1 Tax=Bradyrhizobium japonicum TaxID=375 RepID=UPI00040C28ED|nr:DNA/RNA non-specific endonuclease [Bradyrhizobium japonicum]WLB86864.1 DNA/RNA non-specific endonuclease [Bradyrhizobium japonicum USDA 135]